MALIQRGRHLLRYSTIVRAPPSTAPREVPTPLVFVSAKEWDPQTSKGVTFFSSMLAAKGYTSLQTNLSYPVERATDSMQLMHYFASELAREIRLSMIPFPPIIFATSSACLIAQTYVSSHPATGLFMISPPVSNSAVAALTLSRDLPEFTFEPKFPIGVMATKAELEKFRTNHRLGGSADMVTVPDVEGNQALAAIETWLDELGI